tara:strand:+ start:4022 stop:5179 length:1158 start_codon:yes stop_codon:yes gene_type:complete
MHKDTYCPMPFVTLAVNPNNWLTRCMMSNYNMGPIERDAWSNDKFTTLRTDMLAGKWDEDGCHSCWYKEQNGQTSRRNKWFSQKGEKKYMGEENVYVKNLNVRRNKIKHLYMNFNNICNFKCRMCGPHFSNAWIPDWKKMGGKYDASQSNPKQQIDVDKFLQEFGPELGELHGIWITGGEPFMDNSVFDFLDKLKQYVDPIKVKLLITTNASKLDVSRLEELKDYLRTQIHVSIDATGDLYPYMRGYNYTWEEVNVKIQQLNKWQKGGRDEWHNTLSLNGTYQVYNMCNLEEFYNWCLSYVGIDYIEHRVLTGPKQLQARHASDEQKQQAMQQVLRLQQRYPDHEYFKDIIKELTHDSIERHQKYFVEWSTKLDKIRGETYDYNR